MRISKTERVLQEMEKWVLSARKTELVVYTNSEEMKQRILVRLPGMKVEVVKPEPYEAILEKFPKELLLTDQVDTFEPTFEIPVEKSTAKRVYFTKPFWDLYDTNWRPKV